MAGNDCKAVPHIYRLSKEPIISSTDTKRDPYKLRQFKSEKEREEYESKLREEAEEESESGESGDDGDEDDDDIYYEPRPVRKFCFADYYKAHPEHAPPFFDPNRDYEYVETDDEANDFE